MKLESEKDELTDEIDTLRRALRVLEHGVLPAPERKALNALHVWLHHPYDGDLIEECEDFHEGRMHDCKRAIRKVQEDGHDVDEDEPE